MGLLTESCCCWLHLHFWKGEAGVSMQCSNLVLFILPHVILQDLSVKIARSGFKWCSPVLSAGSVPHHQVVWKYPLPLSTLLGDRWVCDGRSWSLAGTASAADLPRKQQCFPAWPGMGWEVELCCYSEQNSDGNCKIQSLQLSSWGN